MKTSQANLINALTLIIMPIWAYLTYEATAAIISKDKAING